MAREVILVESKIGVTLNLVSKIGLERDDGAVIRVLVSGNSGEVLESNEREATLISRG